MRFGGKEFWQSYRQSRTNSLMNDYADFKSEVYGQYEFQTYSKMIQKIGKERLILIVYKGVSGKNISNYYYNSEESRQDAINVYKRTADLRLIEKAEKKTAQMNLVNPFKVGDILYSSWGYDQTNIDFYEVVEVLPKSVKIIKISQSYVEDGYDVVANKSVKIGEVMLKKVRANSKYVKISSYSHAYIWDGSPVYQTDPYSGH